MASLNDQKVLAFMFDPFLLETINSEEPNEIVEEIKELTLEQKQAKQLELEGIEFCNSNQSEQALNKFNAAAELWPNRASIYNNRAQVYRLINRIDDAFDDLNRAISLSDQTNPLVARQAYCQRGLIHLLRENREQGINDMKLAAEMGNGFAKSYIAKLNPYAALCNQMLKEMFEQYKLPIESTCSTKEMNGHH
ncbi:hypothetical protein RDWZM_002926 [Blomia tropicalis]|uniref:Tetratricopeptide repeat protein 36 n=1 Tax=Blomia tropicalis TaxID=40697 RepID=A0A9Q0RSL4_BLOTA|nr:hypothetical protein RDWZM_002926 [Blomia tropicalis]